MIAHRPGEDDLIPGARRRARHPGAQDQPHPGGGDKDLVGGALGHHLGVPGDDGDPGFGGGGLHGLGDGLQDGDFQALLQDEGGRQHQGPGRGGEEVVHRARHRQPADVAAGEKQRVHHEGVGGEGEPVGPQQHGGAVVAHPVRVAVPGQKDLVDEGRHLPAAGAVAQKNT